MQQDWNQLLKQRLHKAPKTRATHKWKVMQERFGEKFDEIKVTIEWASGWE